MIRLGKRLRKLRIEKGYSQEYLAHELNMSQGNYCKLESDHHFPSGVTLEKLARLYEIKEHDLLAYEDRNLNNHKISRDSISILSSQELKIITLELMASKDRIIELQAIQIQSLENQLYNLQSKKF
jgi:transcriptional regulator with XRE-family HTH domain